MTTTIGKDEALKKGYLEDKTIILKPSPRGANMNITDKSHIAYFQHDGCSTFFCLPRSTRGDLVNIFKDDEEIAFFEKALGTELNPAKKGNLFETFQVKVTKDSSLLHRGVKFKMSDPMDNIRVKVLMANSNLVAPSEQDRLKKNTYRWYLVDESKLNKEAEVEFGSKQEFWMLVGKYNSTPDMRILLKIYFGSINSKKTVPADASKALMMKELNTLSENDKSRNEFIKIVEDKLFDSKKMVIQALSCDAIKKDGNDTYVFAGEEETFTFNEIAKKLYTLKEEDDDLYFKIKGLLEASNKE